MSAASLVSTARRGPVLALSLDNPPAQAISRRLVAELLAHLAALEHDPPRALVITAAGERFFSAGLDLLELYELDRAAMESFGRDMVGMFLRLFRLPFPVVAAVNGHAIAGGAILALTADRRYVALGEHLFGLNEIQVGLPLPGALFEVVAAAIGERHASELLLEGKNCGVAEAVERGLAHEALARQDLVPRAMALAEKLAGVPPSAYRRMKSLLHAAAEERIERWLVNDPFIEIWFEPETRRVMGVARDRLLAKRRGGTGFANH